MHRRKYLSTISVTAVGLSLAGCSGDSDTTNGGGQVTAEWKYKEYNKVRFPSQSEGVFFESDSESQYVGVQLRLTNETGGSTSLVYDGFSTPELALSADGNTDDVSIHNKSDVSPLEDVSAGETVETALLYIAPPDASDYAYEVRDEAKHTYTVNENEDLEINLVEV